MQEFGTGLPASRLCIGPLLRCSRTAKGRGRAHRVRSGIAELRRHGAGHEHSNRRATPCGLPRDAHGNNDQQIGGGKRMGNAGQGLGCKLWERKALLNVYALQCMAIHRCQRA